MHSVSAHNLVLNPRFINLIISLRLTCLWLFSVDTNTIVKNDFHYFLKVIHSEIKAPRHKIHIHMY